jgi:hypothetical protein
VFGSLEVATPVTTEGRFVEKRHGYINRKEFYFDEVKRD